MQVWLNGTFIPRDEARLSVFDAGLQHGVGLFETLTAHRGKLFRPAAHVSRLINSARDLLLTEQLRLDPLIEAMEHTLTKNELSEARLRLTVTGGDLNMLQSQGKGRVDPTILIVAQPPTVYPDQFFSSGVMVTIADARLNPLDALAGHKTLNYWPRLMALQSAAGHKAGEAMWFSVTNHLACGSVSNVFLVKDGLLRTPVARGEEEAGALKSPVLPGVTRAAIIELAEEQGTDVERQMLDINDLLAADEVFLTNSSWGVLPVVAVEKQQIATGEVGELTKRLRSAYVELVDRETK
jgi:branched-chain amino acid aminotransferase